VSSLEAVELGQLIQVHTQIGPRVAAARRAWGDQGVSWGTQDLVQRIIPTRASGELGKNGNGVAGDDLVIWTAEGKLGIVGFGTEMWSWEEDRDPQDIEQVMEDEYNERIRRALLTHEDEINALPGLGLLFQ